MWADECIYRFVVCKDKFLQLSIPYTNNLYSEGLKFTFISDILATLILHVKPTDVYLHIVLHNKTLNIYSSLMQGDDRSLRPAEADNFSIPLLKHWIILFIAFSEVNLEMVYVYSDHTR
jgi:hypothetical protein